MCCLSVITLAISLKFFMSEEMTVTKKPWFFNNKFLWGKFTVNKQMCQSLMTNWKKPGSVNNNSVGSTIFARNEYTL